MKETCDLDLVPLGWLSRDVASLEESLQPFDITSIDVFESRDPNIQY